MGIEAALIGGLLAGASSIGGAAMSNAANKKMADQANQTTMQASNTAHQREVADLRAAGLNPILSAGSAGAAVPTQQIQTQQNPLASLPESLSKGITNVSALQSMRQIDPQIAKTRSETKLNDALTLKAAADTTTAVEAGRLHSAHASAVPYSTRKTEAETSAIKYGSKPSSFIGSEATKNLYHNLSSAKDTISRKLRDIISSVTMNSAKKVSSPSPKNSSPDWNYSKVKRKDGSTYELFN